MKRLGSSSPEEGELDDGETVLAKPDETPVRHPAPNLPPPPLAPPTASVEPAPAQVQAPKSRPFPFKTATASSSVVVVEQKAEMSRESAKLSYERSEEVDRRIREEDSRNTRHQEGERHGVEKARDTDRRRTGGMDSYRPGHDRDDRYKAGPTHGWEEHRRDGERLRLPLSEGSRCLSLARPS